MSSLFDLPFEDEPDDEGPRRDEQRRRTEDDDHDASWAAWQDPPPAATSDRATPARQDRRVFSVRELTAALRQRIEDAFPRVWVEGELAECKRWQSGHVYFTLKDGDAQIQGVMFRTDAARLRFAPRAGLQVLVRGRVSVYPLKGQYQIHADAMEPRGAGALQVAFEEVKRRLQAEGLFDLARKRPLPMLPRRVGVVTSPDGAALRDILRVLRTRRAPVDVVVSPARVQGDGAAADLARALRRVALVDRVDVVIVGRGGGAAEDLWAFNDEHLARVIAACPVPVVAAVGHEVDTTIADFVADLRAATPSQAAELVVRQATEFAERLDTLTRHLTGAVRAGIERRRVALLAPRRQRPLARVRDAIVARDRARIDATLALVAAARRRAQRDRERLRTIDDRLAALHPRARFAARLRRVVEGDVRLAAAGRQVWQRRAVGHTRLVEQLDAASPAADIAAGRRALDVHAHRLQAAAAAGRHRARAQALALAGRLENLSPLRTLARGYAACWDDAHTRLIRSVADTAPGARVHVQVRDGELHCHVDALTPGRRDAP